MIQNKMFGFVKKIFMTAIAFIGWNASNEMNTIPLKCVSKSNQERRKRQVLINIDNTKPLFFP